MNLNKSNLNLFQKLMLHVVVILTFLHADTSIDERTNWTVNDTNTSKSGIPTNLQYFKYYDVLPDEVALEIFKEKDLSSLAGKRIFVGYGTVDPTGTDCRVFPSATTGLDNNSTICLPWWRIERDYQLSASTTTDFEQFFCTMPQPRPPQLVNVCSEWQKISTDYDYPGGKVTCTSYYNRLLSASCWDNPKQQACFVNNCSDYVKKNCTSVANVMGDVTTLQTAKYSDNTNDHAPVAFETKLDVLTYQYQCPAGSLVPNQKCLNEKAVLMFPYECKADNAATLVDDGEYIYCDKDKAQYDASGNVVGFLGACKDGRTVMCEANGLTETKMECTAPVYAQTSTVGLQEEYATRTYVEKSVDVLSGETDIYAENPLCIRSNTVKDSRDKEIYIKVRGAGYLDDDIYLIRHLENGDNTKEYCNMQHAGQTNPTKMYNGNILTCIANNGNYVFDKSVKINSTDIVSIQQASENELSTNTPFALGRNHYRSTKVTIDDVLAIPDISSEAYPYYPNSGFGTYMKTWDNALTSLAIMFPFSGSYSFQFFSKNGDVIAETTIGIEQFESISEDGYYRLRLGENMTIASGVDKTSACITDDLVDVGGGVYGGKGSKTGAYCASPNDAYVKENAITTILVKDLLLGTITQIPLVYPIAYPNMIFISKLNVYETRKYRCYNTF